MFSNKFNIPYDDERKLFEIFTDNSIVFSPKVTNFSNDLVTLIDEYSKNFSSTEYKDVCCVYQYTLFDKPVYVGMSHNGHTYRFSRQLKSIFVDKNKNMKSPSRGYNKKNSRDRFIYDIHDKGFNLRALSLKVLSLESDNLGEFYDYVKGFIDRFGVSMYEQVLMNSYYRSGKDTLLLNVNPPANTSNALLSVKTNSQVVNEIREEKISVYDFYERVI